MSTSPSNTSTLHYGGSISPKTGRLGAKTGPAATFRKMKRLETLVRMEEAGLPPSQIAPMLCISLHRLKSIQQSPDYLQVRMKITKGIIIDNTGELALIKEQRREILTQMLPPALQVLANELQQPARTIAERKHKTNVALELLDREGTFAKVSRTEIKPVDQFSFESMENESQKVIAAVRKHAPPLQAGTDSVKAAIDTNALFSNSRTIDATEQQQALTELEEEAALLESVPADAPIN